MLNSRPNHPTIENHSEGISDATRLTRNGRPLPVSIRALQDIPGFPSRHEGVPDYLSCKEVCQQYPNNLRDDMLDCFLHYNWSARQIFDALPPTAKSSMTSNHTTGQQSRSPYNVISKRLEKRRARHVRAGVLDEVMTAGNIRPEGQGPHFRGAGRLPLRARQAIARSKSPPIVSTPINADSSNELAAAWPAAAGPVHYAQYDPAPSDFAESSTMSFDDTAADISTSDYYTDVTDFTESSGMAFENSGIGFPGSDYYADFKQSSSMSYEDATANFSAPGYYDTVFTESEAFAHGQSILRPSVPPPSLHDLGPGGFNFATPIDDSLNAHDSGAIVDDYYDSYSNVYTGQPVYDQSMTLYPNLAMNEAFDAVPPGLWQHDNDEWLNTSHEPPRQYHEYPDPTDFQLSSCFEYDSGRGHGIGGYD